MLSEEKIKELARYCHIDGDLTDEDQQELNAFYDDAVSYMDGAGIDRPAHRVDLWEATYWRCVKMMVLDAYDRRRSVIDSVSVRENPAFRRRINQLKLICLVSNSDTRRPY